MWKGVMAQAQCPCNAYDGVVPTAGARRSPENAWAPNSKPKVDVPHTKSQQGEIIRRQSWRQDSLDKQLARFDDLAVHADSVIFCSKPLTTGLLLPRWQVLLICFGVFSMVFGVIWGLNESCDNMTSHTAGRIWKALVTCCLGSCYMSMPVMTRYRLLHTQAALRCLGCAHLARGVFNLMMITDDVVIALGLNDGSGLCSSHEIRLQLFWRLGNLLHLFTAYVYLRSESLFPQLLCAWALRVGVQGLVDGIVTEWRLTHAGYACFSCTILIFCSVSLHRRRRKVLAARQAVAEDERAYDEAWQRIRAQEDVASVCRVASSGQSELSRHRIVRQHVDGLDCLMGDAKQASEGFRALVRKIAERSGGACVLGGLKKPERSLQKLRRNYKDDSSRLCDLVRGSLVYDGMSGIAAGLALLNEEVTIVRLKNRFDPKYDATASAGYRDVSVNLEFRYDLDRAPHICELQLHHASMFALKSEGGHKRYIEFRDSCGG
eukprot:TRINITY_DN13060_c0_g1_i1.p1 TRINITY_DN13060_c0_g1~~TRINITY_DN13060_c0_g1_i1.p1  ORF type:complete len:491 (+),score=30.46 TRINITY_DN13060_c0_g1_i1:102-1574(+)